MNLLSARKASLWSFAFFLAWVFSLPFDGDLLYLLLESQALHQIRAYVLLPFFVLALGLLTCGFLVRSRRQALRLHLLGLLACLLLSFVLFLGISRWLWLVLALQAFFASLVLATWGELVGAERKPEERLKLCADVLILCSLLVIVLNLFERFFSLPVALVMAVLYLLFSVLLLLFGQNREALASEAAPECRLPAEKLAAAAVPLRVALLWLSLFMFLVLLNLGLMYEVITESYWKLPPLIRQFWLWPFFITLIIIRLLSRRAKPLLGIYLAMGLTLLSFLSLMLGSSSMGLVLLANALLLSAQATINLFSWTILTQMLDYSAHPARVFGMGLSATVFGMIAGELLGRLMHGPEASDAHVAVWALVSLCISLAILPTLDQKLKKLFGKESTRFFALQSSDENRQPPAHETARHETAPFEDQSPEAPNSKAVTGASLPEHFSSEALNRLMIELTAREKDTLKLLLDGFSNREIACRMNLSENTVKTHIRGILTKFGAKNRTELLVRFYKR